MSAGMQVYVLLVWPAAPTRFSFCRPPFPCFLSNARRADTPSHCSSGHQAKSLRGCFWVPGGSSPCAQTLLTSAAMGSVPGDQADPCPWQKGAAFPCWLRVCSSLCQCQQQPE